MLKPISQWDNGSPSEVGQSRWKTDSRMEKLKRFLHASQRRSYEVTPPPPTSTFKEWKKSISRRCQPLRRFFRSMSNPNLIAEEESTLTDETCVSPESSDSDDEHDSSVSCKSIDAPSLESTNASFNFKYTDEANIPTLRIVERPTRVRSESALNYQPYQNDLSGYQEVYYSTIKRSDESTEQPIYENWPCQPTAPPLESHCEKPTEIPSTSSGNGLQTWQSTGALEGIYAKVMKPAKLPSTSGSGLQTWQSTEHIYAKIKKPAKLPSTSGSESAEMPSTSGTTFRTWKLTTPPVPVPESTYAKLSNPGTSGTAITKSDIPIKEPLYEDILDYRARRNLPNPEILLPAETTFSNWLMQPSTSTTASSNWDLPTTSRTTFSNWDVPSTSRTALSNWDLPSTSRTAIPPRQRDNYSSSEESEVPEKNTVRIVQVTKKKPCRSLQAPQN